MVVSVTLKEDKFLDELKLETIKELNNFYGINIEPNLITVYEIEDRKTIDKMLCRKTKCWLSAFTNNYDVHVIKKENYNQETCKKYSEKSYIATFKHEMSHVYNTMVVGLKNQYAIPFWLSEGIPIFISGQLSMKKAPERLINFIDFFSKESEGNVYKESGFVVSTLIHHFGKSNLLTLLKKSTISKVKDRWNKDEIKEFKEIFKDIYGFDLNYQEINKLYLEMKKSNEF